MTPSATYRDADRIKLLAGQIAEIAADRPMTIMEVCGTHTMAVARHGLRGLLPLTMRLISGPGCPVCVTPNSFLDHAIALSKLSHTTIATFGDLVRVPGSSSSLERERAAGRDIRPVYSTIDALEIARSQPTQEVIFLGVGFETTAPTIAAAIATAREEGTRNFSVLAGCRVIPPALEALLAGITRIDGFILPGHVSTIIGAGAYRDLIKRHEVSAAIAGFEPIEILEAILALATQIQKKSPALTNAYARAVTEEGNVRAMGLMREVFEPCDANWRGIGTIPGSGLAIRREYAAHDAAARFAVKVPQSREPQGCICGRILTGQAAPADCPLFGKTCTPEHPVGACMVSSEGTCAAAATFGTGYGL